MLKAQGFPWRWAPQVIYRQAGWTWHALREGRLGGHVAGAFAGLRLAPAMLRERGRLRARAEVPIETVVPARPIRGTGARA